MATVKFLPMHSSGQVWWTHQWETDCCQESLTVSYVILIYVVHSISFKTFCTGFLNCHRLLWDDWPIFMISGSNKQLQQQLEYTILKPDCHSWWTSKMQSDTLEEWYAIKFCFKLGKMPQKRMECFRLLFDHLAWIEHQFLSGIRDSRKAESLWGMMRGVGGVRKSEHQSWLARVDFLWFEQSKIHRKIAIIYFEVITDVQINFVYMSTLRNQFTFFCFAVYYVQCILEYRIFPSQT